MKDRNRNKRFVSEEDEFVIVSGPRRGQVLGNPTAALNDAHRSILAHLPDPPAAEDQKPEQPG